MHTCYTSFPQIAFFFLCLLHGFFSAVITARVFVRVIIQGVPCHIIISSSELTKRGPIKNIDFGIIHKNNEYVSLLSPTPDKIRRYSYPFKEFEETGQLDTSGL
ncbi:Bgt-20703 [Blumeria graminis f. sp. tritici]|uniref:Bgt-20703 n=2 Tax=Blumeria graminis f. sp. tritici TaxID=62690 RepID=A0A381L5N3_BLUGR|nr:Bgt-20703 [Blumeria graminis f. sp. tritici]